MLRVGITGSGPGSYAALGSFCISSVTSSHIFTSDFDTRLTWPALQATGTYGRCQSAGFPTTANRRQHANVVSWENEFRAECSATSRSEDIEHSG